MIFLNDTNDFSKYFDTEKSFLNDSIKSQELTKSIICKYMQNFADSIDNIDSNLASDIMNFFNSLKSSLNLCNQNITYLNSILTSFEQVVNAFTENKDDLSSYVNSFNLNYIDLNKTIMENTLKIEECLTSIPDKSKLTFSVSSTNSEISESINKTSINPEMPLESEDTSEQEVPQIINYTEDTLLISEMSGNVILPYRLEALNEILENNTEKYSSIQDIIQKKYTIPISLYKNTPIARFREAFKLMRNKEKASIKDAFDLSIELIFNYNLHPAIISACKSLDELDIYLDYLETGETDKFDCFKIVFEFPPALVK